MATADSTNQDTVPQTGTPAGNPGTASTPQQRPAKRVALYMRVSTSNKGQTTATQAGPLREHAQHRGFTIVEEYRDEGISGAKQSRPQLDRLMADARRRRFDAVIVQRFDRFARSTKHLVLALEEFSSLNIDFISLNESIDTSSAMGKLVFVVIAGVAELERAIIRERVQAGVDRARREGKTLGRRRRVFDHERARKMSAYGMSVRAIAGVLGVSKTVIAEALAAGKGGGQ